MQEIKTIKVLCQDSVIQRTIKKKRKKTHTHKHDHKHEYMQAHTHMLKHENRRVYRTLPDVSREEATMLEPEPKERAKLKENEKSPSPTNSI